MKKTFSPWFYSNSLSADYGKFTCSECGSEFYHSPSDIYEGENKIQGCVCGNCINIIFSEQAFK